jgi:hypothetical protein
MLNWQDIRLRGPWLFVKLEYASRTFYAGGVLEKPDFLTVYEQGQTGFGVVLKKGASVDKVVGGPYLGVGARVLFRDFVKLPTERLFGLHEDRHVALFNAKDIIGVVEE